MYSLSEQIKRLTETLSKLNEDMESFIPAYKAMAANNGEPTIDNPRLLAYQLAMILRSQHGSKISDKDIKVLVQQYIRSSTTYQMIEQVTRLISSAPTLESIKKYIERSQAYAASQAANAGRRRQVANLQHQLTLAQLAQQIELTNADTAALKELDVRARQEIKAETQKLELEAKERMHKMQEEIASRTERGEVREHELRMAQLKYNHEINVIKITAEGEYKKAKLEFDYQIHIKQLEHIDNQRERQNRLDVLNAEKRRQIELIDTETAARIREATSQASLDADKRQHEVDLAIYQAFALKFKDVWGTVLDRVVQATGSIGNTVRNLMRALTGMSKPNMPNMSAPDSPRNSVDESLELQRIKRLSGL
jgi:hypothetical protein